MTTERIDERNVLDDEARSRGFLSIRNFAAFSIVHSVFFTGLCVCAFFLAKPQPATFVFGFLHGVMYALMAVLCIIATRKRIMGVTTALVVVIVGLCGPYFGAYEFVREEKRIRSRRALAEASG